MDIFDFNISNLQDIVLKLIFLAFCGLVLRQTLVITGQRWANTFHHLGSYILLPNIALVITTVIKNDIALSLGMIGALSIVRFRNPVKSPFELVMFFALLTLGVVTSVSGKLALVLFIFLVLVLFFINYFQFIAKKFNKNLYQFSFGEGNLVYTMELNSKKEIKELEKNKNIIQSFEDLEKSNFFYRLAFSDKKDLEVLKKLLEQNKDIINIKSDYQA